MSKASLSIHLVTAYHAPQVSKMVGDELRTLMEGKEGTPVRLGLERREGPDMFGNYRLRHLVRTLLCCAHAFSSLSELRPKMATR